MLDNITVVDTDLVKVAPGIGDYKFPGQEDFSEPIAEVKRRLYLEIQQKFSYTTEQMEDVKDTPTETLKDRIVYLTLAKIALANGMLDKAEAYKQEALAVPLEVFYDHAQDGEAADADRELGPRVTFGR